MPSSKALKKSTSSEITHTFYLLFVFVFESSMLLLNFLATPLYLYFAVFVVPRRVANAKLLFTFVTAGNRLLFVTVLGITRP